MPVADTMVSLYFNVFSSLSLSNLLPRVQLSSLMNNQNPNSLLNRFGIQDTVTDLLNRVGFDQTFSIGNKIGIDRPDSILNKVELGMNNVINVNQQGLLNPGQGLGGLYGGNGPGQYPGGSGGGISGVGTYGAQAGVSGSGGGPFGTQASWQGQTQGSFPIGGNRPPGYPPEGQFGGGPPDSGGGIGNSQAFANGPDGQTGNAGGGGLLSGILNQVGNRFGWGSSTNKNDPKEYYKQGGTWWVNQENSQEYWLEESLRDVLDTGRTADNQSEAVLKYLVETQIKKLIATLLQHLAEAKVKPVEQVKMNEAAETELRKLTPEQIKRIAHDIVEREKSKLNELNRQKVRGNRKPAGGLTEDDLKQLLVESTKENEIKLDRAEIAKLVEMTRKVEENERNQVETDVNKTTMNHVIQQLTQNTQPKPSALRLEDNAQDSDEKITSESHGNQENHTVKTGGEDGDDKIKKGLNKEENADKPLTNSNTESAESNRPQLYISEQMRTNINELLAQLAGNGPTKTSPPVNKQSQPAGNKQSHPAVTTPVTTTKRTPVTMTTETFVTTPSAPTTITDQPSNPVTTYSKHPQDSGDDGKVKEDDVNTSSKHPQDKDDDKVNEDDVKLLLQRLFGNANEETLRPFLPQRLARETSSSQAMETNLENAAGNRTLTVEKTLANLRLRSSRKHDGLGGSDARRSVEIDKNSFSKNTHMIRNNKNTNSFNNTKNILYNSKNNKNVFSKNNSTNYIFNDDNSNNETKTMFNFSKFSNSNSNNILYNSKNITNSFKDEQNNNTTNNILDDNLKGSINSLKDVKNRKREMFLESSVASRWFRRNSLKRAGLR